MFFLWVAFQHHLLPSHCYSDDSQTYPPPKNSLAEIQSQIPLNIFNLNEQKTEVTLTPRVNVNFLKLQNPLYKKEKQKTLGVLYDNNSNILCVFWHRMSDFFSSFKGLNIFLRKAICVVKSD